MIHYLKTRWMDWLGCVCIAVGMSIHVYAGYVLSDPLSQSPLAVFGTTMLVMAVLFLLAYRRLTVWLGLAGGVVAALGVVVYVQLAKPLSDQTANSLFFFFLITVLSALIVFLLTRSRAGCIILFLIGNIIPIGSYFLEFPVSLWAFLLLVAAEIFVFLLRVYAAGAAKAITGKVQIRRYGVQTIVVCAVVLAVAVGLFMGIIRTLSPPTQELKLVTVLKNMQVVQVLGVAQTKEYYDPTLAAGGAITDDQPRNEQGDEQNDKNDGQAQDSSPDGVGDGSSSEDNASNGNSSSDSNSGLLTINPNLLQELTAVRYRLTDQQWIWVFGIIVLLIVAIFVLRVVLKRLWHKRVESLPHEDAILNYYEFYLKRFKRIGFPKPKNYTLWEYARSVQHDMEAFNSENGSFHQLTELYSRVYYGNGTVSDEEYGCFQAFYKGFHKNLLREIGVVKYGLNLFRI